MNRSQVRTFIFILGLPYGLGRVTALNDGTVLVEPLLCPLHCRGNVIGAVGMDSVQTGAATDSTGRYLGEDELPQALGWGLLVFNRPLSPAHPNETPRAGEWGRLAGVRCSPAARWGCCQGVPCPKLLQGSSRHQTCGPS